jgi:IS4 transposase
MVNNSSRREVWGLKLYVAGTKLPDGDFLIVVSSNSPEMILTDYAKRWEIETLFGCLKTHKFLSILLNL